MRLIINEIEYDQAGTDDAEYVELKAAGGAPLAGWKLEFYNGNNGEVYREVDLSTLPGGVMPADGYLVVGTATAPEVDLVAWDSNEPFQNGPDGLVLSLGTYVVEALSYETGTNGFLAVGGTANGELLHDPGVSDSGATTMQKIPDGSTDPADWVATNNQTPGVENFDAGVAGACCDPNTLECTITTEIECTTAGGVFQGTGVTCGEYTCQPQGSCCEPDGSCRADVAEAQCDRLGGTWTEGGVCPDAEGFVACLTGPSGVDVRTPECAMWDLDGDALDIDLADFALLQQLTCAGDPVGACCLPDGSCEEISQWTCETFHGPGSFNGVGVACGAVSCSPEPAGTILINEIWADDPGTDDHEFIELFGPASMSLDGLSLIVVDGDTFGATDSFQYRRVNLEMDLTGYSTDAQGYFLIGTGPDITPDVNLDAVFGDNDGVADELQNGSQTYALVNSTDIAYCTGIGAPDASCNTSGMQLTQASYDAITAGAIDTIASRIGDYDHFYFYAPLVQDDGFYVFDYGQRIPNGTDNNVAGDWETVFGNELGDPSDPSTPGSANQSFDALLGACCSNGLCHTLTEADCLAIGGTFGGQGSSCSPNPCDCRELSEIADVQFPATEPVCVTNAIVTDVYDRVNSTTSKHFFIQDQSAVKAWLIHGSNTEIDPLLGQIEPGDIVEMTGTHQEYFNTQQLVAPFTITVLGQQPLPAPFVTTVDDFDENFPINEQYLSTRVTITNARFQAGDQGNPFAYGNYTIEDATNPALTMALRIGNSEPGALPILGTTIPSGTVEITGIMTIFSDVWQIQPAVPGDVVVVGP